MKQIIVFFALAFLLTSVNGIGQNVSETSFTLGINKAQSTSIENYYNLYSSPPLFLNVGLSHSWYQTNKRVTFNKEIGMNLQYSNFDIGSGGLGGQNYDQWKVLNWCTEATFQAQFRLDSLLSVGFGPAAECLIMGYNELRGSYYRMFNPPISGKYSHSGINRDLFNDLLWGVRFSILNSGVGKRATVRVNISYLWMKENHSNFYSSGLVKVGIAVGFNHKKVKTKTA